MRQFRLLAISLCLSAAALRAETTAAGSLVPERAAAHEAFAARRDSEAQAGFEKLLAANPADDEALYHLGRLAKRRGDWTAVATHYERCTQLAPQVALYWADLGEAYGKLAGKAGIFQQLGLARKCRAALEKAVELEPENREYREGLIEFCEKAPGIAGGGRDKALVQAAEIGKRDPFAGAMITGGIQSRAKDTEAAERAFRDAARLDPQSDDPLAALGLLYADAGRFLEAFAQFDQLLTRNPGNFAALYQIGRVAALSGERLGDGESALRRYLERDAHPAGQPTNAHAHLRLGEILARRGDKNAARAEFRAALQLDAGLKPAAEALRKLGD
ncbi:MAG TPA: tetratricopeptide repeat protein [Opitutaceae bacterium]|nr:tetratricopeptide repeat protein [Opitutaceae bacterium]